MESTCLAIRQSQSTDRGCIVKTALVFIVRSAIVMMMKKKTIRRIGNLEKATTNHYVMLQKEASQARVARHLLHPLVANLVNFISAPHISLCSLSVLITLLLFPSVG